MDLLQTLLVYMSLVFTASVQSAPEPSMIPPDTDYSAGYTQIVTTPTVAPTPVPTIAITPNPAYHTLKMGDKGSEVRKLQETLKEYGYYTAEVDGAYGNQTRQAVEKFQYMHGLSADGMAGRHTLTVLYESNQIRLPQGMDTTPAPTSETQLAVAFTPTPSPDPTETPAPTPANTPEAVPQPTEVPVQADEMTGYTIVFDQATTDWKAYRQDETVYLPILEALKASNIYVISSSSLQLDEYAFASGLNFVRFTHTENQQGDPIHLQIYFNDEPQLVLNRTLCCKDGVLYIPAEAVEILTGMQVTVDNENKQILIAKHE